MRPHILRRSSSVVVFCLLAWCFGFYLKAQQPENGYVQFSVTNPPPELPSARTVVSISRLGGSVITTAPTCEGGTERGGHVRARDERAGIEISSPLLSSTGPFLPANTDGCGYGKVVPSVLSGTDQGGTFILGAEDDRLTTGSGDDRIDAGAGDDVIDGGAGNDLILGTDGNDRLTGGAGNDNLYAGPGDDRIDAGAGDDVAEGGAGDDVIDGGDGVDTLFGDEGNDVIRAGAGNDVVEGNAGDDRLEGGDGNDEIVGGRGDDRLDGGAGDDWLKGEAGNDTLVGGVGADRLEGQDGADTIDGGAGNDFLDGGDDRDILNGGPGDDTMYGGDDGADIMDGGAGNDRLYGNDDDDRLDGGQGDDLLDGGDDNDMINGGDGADRILGGEGNDFLFGGAGADLILGGPDNDFIDGGANDDELQGDEGNDTIDGGPGNDRLYGGRGADVLRGADGNDTIFISAGDTDLDEVIDGGQGVDVLVLDGFGPGLISGIPGPNSSFTIKDPLTNATYHVTRVEIIRHSTWLSYLGVTPQSGSTLTLANPSTTSELRGKAEFYGDDGRPFAVSVNGAAADPSMEIRLLPLGTAEFQLTTTTSAIGVRTNIQTNSPVVAAVGFTSTELGNTRLSQNALTSSFVIPVVQRRAAGTTTSIMVINGPTGGHYELALVPPGGAPLRDATDITLPPDSQMFRSVEQLFPQVEDFEGTLWLSGAALAVGVRRTGTELSVLPVQAADDVSDGIAQAQAQAQGAQAAQGAPLPPAGRNLFFARFAAGNGVSSTFVIMNPSRSLRAKGTLEFFAGSGTPLAVPISGQGSQTTMRFDLAPGGSTTYRVDTPATPIEGSARLRMQEASAQAMLQYSDGRNGTTSIAPTGLFESLIAPVHHAPPAQSTTLVAVSSAGPASIVRLSLRDERGQVVPGGTANVNLQPNGMFSRSLTELFPQAAPGFTGSVTATSAPEASVSATILEQAGGRVTAQPVSPLE